MMAPNDQLLRLFTPFAQFKSEMVWLISCYVEYVLKTAYIKDSQVQVDKLFGFLRFKFKNIHGSQKLNLTGLECIFK